MDLCQQISKLIEQIKENIKENDILKDERDKNKDIIMGMIENSNLNNK